MIEKDVHFKDLKNYILGGNQEEDEKDIDSQLLDPKEIDSFDFSNLKGSLKKNLKTVKKGVRVKKAKKYKSLPKNNKTKTKVFVPDDRKLIIEGVDKFILNGNDTVRNINYYKGEKLKELVLTFNNTTGTNFTIELFNPSMPLDYLYSTSLNLNDMVVVGGGEVSYSDVLFNLLANPALLVNAKFTFSGNGYGTQRSEPLRFKTKNIMGETVIDPIQTGLFVDTQQFQGDVVFFNITESLNRPYVPDGMDIITYRILAGMTVTLAFFYKQYHLKDFFFEESRNSKNSKLLK